MPTAPPLACPCPPAGALDVVGKKWAVCLVTLLGRHGPQRFARLQASLPRVGPATLSATLRALTAEGLVAVVPVPGDRRGRGAYRLTDDGTLLYRSLLPLARWVRGPGARVGVRGRPPAPRA